MGVSDKLNCPRVGPLYFEVRTISTKFTGFRLLWNTIGNLPPLVYKFYNRLKSENNSKIRYKYKEYNENKPKTERSRQLWEIVE